jgi:methylated-DNA-[protein]-cysteine S-methyltransferase
MSTETAQVETPVGAFRAVVDEGVVRSATFLVDRGTQRDRFGVYDALSAYFDGDVDALDTITTSPDGGTSFQREVWKRLREIRPGETLSYGELARRVGNPSAARAVGMANAANPIALIVPCHRVVRSGGAIGGYGFGVETKRWLLQHEARHASFHWHPIEDLGADAIEDLVETVAGDRESVVAKAHDRA